MKAILGWILLLSPLLANADSIDVTNPYERAIPANQSSFLVLREPLDGTAKDATVCSFEFEPRPYKVGRTISEKTEFNILLPYDQENRRPDSSEIKNSEISFVLANVTNMTSDIYGSMSRNELIAQMVQNGIKVFNGTVSRSVFIVNSSKNKKVGLLNCFSDGDSITLTATKLVEKMGLAADKIRMIPYNVDRDGNTIPMSSNSVVTTSFTFFIPTSGF